MALICPGCRGEMAEVDEAGVLVDVCLTCGGLWLDQGELQKKGGELPPPAIDYRGERRCPRCDRQMMVRPSKVVELDVCPKCCGIYLDANEIDLLVQVQSPAPKEPAHAPPRPAASSGTPMFECELCHRSSPIYDQVIGAQVTVCRPCAQRNGIRHDPQARRKIEQARTQPRAAVSRPAPVQGASGGLFDILATVLKDVDK